MNEGCKPNGPYCIGMRALLEAHVKRGIRNGIQFLPTTGKTTAVVVHAAIVNEKRTDMLFNFCPCCGGRFRTT